MKNLKNIFHNFSIRLTWSAVMSFLFLLLSTQKVEAERLIMGLHGPEPKPELLQSLQQSGLHLQRCFPLARLCIVDAERVNDELLQALRSQLDLRYLERDQLLQVAPRLQQKNDGQGTTQCPDQWELATVGAEQAWAIADGTWAPVIAVQDTGFRLSHEELQGRISGQYDYGNGDTDPEVELGSAIPDHGTFIAAVLVADPDNGVGRSGLAPYARINAQKIADDDGALFFSYAIAAMADLADGDLGVRVLNYSIAGPTATQSFHDAVEALASVGILVVTAAGNCASSNCAEADNDSHPMFPGSYTFDHIVTVAASTRDDGFNTFSHYGRNSVDLAAPGVDICSAGVHADDNYYSAGGTSYATPLVAATAALLLEAHPRLTTTDLARILRVSARPSSAWSDKVKSGGVLDAAQALKTPMPRFDRPGDQVIAAEEELAIPVANIAAAARACLVVEHIAAIDIVAVRDATSQRCWDLQQTGPGQAPITLMDAGEVQSAEQILTVACGPVARHDTALLHLSVRGRNVGNFTVKTRVVMQARDDNYLNSPYSAGVDDLTGFLAWSQNWRVTQVSDAQNDPCLDLSDAGEADALEQDAAILDAQLADNILSDVDEAHTDANVLFDSANSDSEYPDHFSLDSYFDGGSFADVEALALDASIYDKNTVTTEDENLRACNCSTSQQPDAFYYLLFGILTCAALFRSYRKRG